MWKDYLQSLNRALDRWGEFDLASNPDGIICLGADSGWSYAHDMTFFHKYRRSLASVLDPTGPASDDTVQVLSETLGYYAPKTLDVGLLTSAIQISHRFCRLCSRSRFQPLVSTTICRSTTAAAALLGDMIGRRPVAFVGSEAEHREMLPILNAIGSPVERINALDAGGIGTGCFAAYILPGYPAANADALTRIARKARADGAQLPVFVEFGTALTDLASILTLPAVRHFAIRIVPLPTVHSDLASLALVIGSAKTVKRMRNLQGAFNAFPSLYEQRLAKRIMLDEEALTRTVIAAKPARQEASARLAQVFTTEVLERAGAAPGRVQALAASHSAQFLLSELVDLLPGQYVLMPSVCVPFMAHAVEAKGAEIRYYDPWSPPYLGLPEGHDGDRPKFLWLNVPVNPTGAVYTRDQYQAIADWCVAHEVIMVEDHDIHFLYSRPLREDHAAGRLRRVRVYTFSKEFGLPLEFGLAVGDDRVIADLERQLQVRGATCPGLRIEALTSALGVLDASSGGDSIATCTGRIRRTVSWAVDQFRASGFETLEPEAGAKFLVRGAPGCLLPDSWLDLPGHQLSLRLLNRARISFPPADCYGPGLSRWFRVVIDKPFEHVEAMFARLRHLSTDFQ
jgi:aspartate/methionine/tyrosine aminotransferase